MKGIKDKCLCIWMYEGVHVGAKKTDSPRPFTNRQIQGSPCIVFKGNLSQSVSERERYRCSIKQKDMTSVTEDRGNKN